MEWKKGSYRLSDDKSELDLYYIVPALQQSYWAAGRPKATRDRRPRRGTRMGGSGWHGGEAQNGDSR